MLLIKNSKLFQVSAKVGRSEVVRLVLAATTAFIFLPLPDTDFIFLSILHHRSIITHSLLFGFVFLFLGKNTGAAPLAGAMLGLSVHLACDLLSPAVGFGQIWLPYPIKTGLGIFSYVWLSINCAIGFAIAIQWSLYAFRCVFSKVVAFMIIVVTAALYGVLNEKSFYSVAITVLFVLIGFAIQYKWGKFRSSVSSM